MTKEPFTNTRTITVPKDGYTGKRIWPASPRHRVVVAFEVEPNGYSTLAVPQLKRNGTSIEKMKETGSGDKILLLDSDKNLVVPKDTNLRIGLEDKSSTEHDVLVKLHGYIELGV